MPKKLRRLIIAGSQVKAAQLIVEWEDLIELTVYDDYQQQDQMVQKLRRVTRLRLDSFSLDAEERDIVLKYST